MADRKPYVLGRADFALLRAVAGEQVTWRRRDGVHGPTTTSYRRWSTETEYVLVTPVAKRLLAAGLIREEMAAGYSYINRGPVVLTHEGRAALAVEDATNG